ncbi:mycothiol transferase [Tomitella fengzijianii]|uniref:DinB family protein n=1 Tax=Tomitella fengzijianii TaxID=2597660 RepID=A0A516WZP7_9ACTN|nr:DinB family protein [Tomitella fengzijianii]QDQ96319.1 DinB family protein [Tomitella fengzijianii]
MTDSGPIDSGPNDAAAPARALLTDSFGRIREQVAGLTGGVTSDVAAWRPDPEANSIAWLLWHLTRVQDDHLADAAGTGQVWTAPGATPEAAGPSWAERFGLPFPPEATGYGQTAAQVGQVHTDGTLLDGYHADVHAATLRYLDSLTTDELDRVVDRAWDPPVTVAARLVSVIGDCTAHLGQAQYLLGMHRRL